MRTAFIKELIEEAKINKDIFLLVGDLGFSVVEPFAELFPDRFLNVGIAEQNMTGIAAGLAIEGYNVFTYSIGNFPTLRCIEQIRYDVCYHNLNVKVVAVGAGYAYGPLGVSHHTTEDIGMLRTIPNITIASPGDPVEAKKITKLYSSYNGPAYLRLGKAGEPVIHQNDVNIDLVGKPYLVIKGEKKAVFVTGSLLEYAQKTISNNNLNYSLYSFPIIKPFNTDSLIQYATLYDEIITLEEHQISAGFGSLILEQFNILQQQKKVSNIPNIKRIGIEDKFIGFAGSQNYLRQQANLVF